MRHQTQQAQQAREAKLDALHAKLTESVSTLVSGDDWRRALEFSARFRSRSFNNTMLIYLQHYEAFRAGRVPSATPTYVAGFKQWQTLGLAAFHRRPRRTSPGSSSGRPWADR